MNKNVLISTLFFISTNLVYAQPDTGVHFVQGFNWNQVKEKAKAENKFIFIDCYASWCGPCKAMDKETYPLKKAGDFMNERFISFKAQMDTSKKDDEQVKEFYADAHFLMHEYAINEFPTLLFFSPEGKVVHKAVGFKDEQGLIDDSRDAMNPDKQYFTQIEKFKENILDTGYMKELARKTSLFGDKNFAHIIANRYIDILTEDQIYQHDNIWFMVEFTTSTKDRGFAVFRDHQDRIFKADSTIGKAGSKAFVENIIYKEEMKPYESTNNGKPDWTKMKTNVKKYGMFGEDAFEVHRTQILFKTEIEPALKIDPNWDKIFTLIKKQNAGNGEEFLVGSSIVYYLNDGMLPGHSKDYKNFLHAATLYYKKYYSYLSADPLNNWAWTLFERSTDKNELDMALIWSESCLKKSPTPIAYYYDTYANLLYKIGRSQEAISWEEKAIALAPGDKGLSDTYGKMKKGVPTWVVPDEKKDQNK